jgi:hypothetical protein
LSAHDTRISDPHWVEVNLGLEQLNIPVRPELSSHGKPEIFVSFAWSNNSSE